MLETTEAIILHSRKFGDTSKIISIYTKDDGLISVIAKGSRLPKNKFGSSIEPLSHSQITYYKKSERDLFLLSKSELIKNFKHIFDSSEKLCVSLAILESITLTQHNHEANEMIFHLLVMYLWGINECEANEYNYFLKFQIELAKLTGFEFDFNRAAYGQGDEYIYLSIETGEFTSISNKKDSYRLKGELAAYLYKVNNCSLKNLEEIKAPKNNIKEINSMLSRYFAFHLDKYFHYKAFDTN